MSKVTEMVTSSSIAAQPAVNLLKRAGIGKSVWSKYLTTNAELYALTGRTYPTSISMLKAIASAYQRAKDVNLKPLGKFGLKEAALGRLTDIEASFIISLLEGEKVQAVPRSRKGLMRGSKDGSGPRCSYTRGIKKALAALPLKGRCPQCGFVIPKYVGRYPGNCPECGLDWQSLSPAYKLLPGLEESGGGACTDLPELIEAAGLPAVVDDSRSRSIFCETFKEPVLARLVEVISTKESLLKSMKRALTDESYELGVKALSSCLTRVMIERERNASAALDALSEVLMGAMQDLVYDREWARAKSLLGALQEMACD